jgi:RNA-directed DNA polymerase
VYLHYVLDLWAGWWRKKHARGQVIIVRFADDFVTGFGYREDAEAFWAALRERFAEFSLELHPDKTRLIEFGRHAARNRAARGEGKPETFSFRGSGISAGPHEPGGSGSSGKLTRNGWRRS